MTPFKIATFFKSLFRISPVKKQDKKKNQEQKQPVKKNAL